jgi:hypothetical protein
MSSMEPEVKKFLQKIVWTLFSALLWMLVNTLVGIKWGYAFFEGRNRIGSYLFYVWLVLSILALLWIYHRLWKEHL